MFSCIETTEAKYKYSSSMIDYVDTEKPLYKIEEH